MQIKIQYASLLIFIVFTIAFVLGCETAEDNDVTKDTEVELPIADIAFDDYGSSNTAADESFVIEATRIIRINCPVDVEVYDSSNNLVASIKSDEPQDIADSSIISSVNEDGEKLIYLPADADYYLNLTATDNGTMSYSINEYSYRVGGHLRLLNYYDIDIERGDIFTSTVPLLDTDNISDAVLNGSATEYSLFDPYDALIKPSIELIGTEAKEASYMVSVSAEDDYGLVYGQGSRQLGHYAKVNAMPHDGYEFEGWYLANEKISSTAEYRFRVESDVNIIAKFIPNDDFTNNIKNTVEIDKNQYHTNDIVKIQETISNVSTNETVENFHVVTTILDEYQRHIWQDSQPIESLLPGESIYLENTWSIADGSPGSYTVDSTVYQTISSDNSDHESIVFVMEETTFTIVE
ncbi:hypothetical protein J2T56_001245 [Natronobacillus azotifigens]|uniref:Bacterial repeat domain-containing protein n=1 Tax=Natronobacillus azotifigens TaxID=472978 RepID=A0A9J6RBH8_9BACI|nr:hypothetical protein [Natronobacillus azotifigens]MCZ0703040.1 hypothetical protein [Natronobacillus azotifigens]